MKRVKYFTSILCIIISVTVWGQNIHISACQGKLARLDSLLTDTTDINIQDERGRSLLHYAVGCQQKEVLGFLLERGISINLQDNRGEIPLSIAVQFNDQTLFEPLIHLHDQDDFTKEQGAALLQTAVLNENLFFVQKLIEKGVPFDDLNDRGSTPLEIALREGSTEIADYLISIGADSSKVRSFHLQGEYMGQTKPGLTPIMFAPNFVSTENFVHNGVFHPNGKEFYYTIETRKYNRGTILLSKLEGNEWSKPVPAAIPGTYREVGPFISKDGARLYYASNRPINETDSIGSSLDLWMLERDGDGWGSPIHLGMEVNTDGNDWFPTISDNGTLYFYTHKDRSGNILYAESENGKYQKGRLIEGVGNGEFYNYDPLIAPDESYLIFSSRGRPDGLGGSDLYVSFKDDQGNWTAPKNMGEGVNSEEGEYAPLLTPDGNYLFFARGYGDIYWVDAKLIENLK